MIYVAVLTGVTAVWGWTFVVVKDAVRVYPVAPFLALRFGLALLVLVLLARRLPDRRSLAAGSLIGVAVAAGYAFQTYGLESAPAGTAGVITGLFVVFTPLIDRAFGARVGTRTWIAVAVALGGTGLLAATGRGALVSAGDLLVLGGAIAFAVQIVLLAHRGPGLRPMDLAILQMAVCWVLFSAAGSTSLSAPDGNVWIGVVITGVFASALAFPLQAWAQARMDATRAALILAMEPAWAMFFAVVLGSQRLDAPQAAGALLVLAAILGHELAPALGARRRGSRAARHDPATRRGGAG